MIGNCITVVWDIDIQCLLGLCIYIYSVVQSIAPQKTEEEKALHTKNQQVH